MTTPARRTPAAPARKRGRPPVITNEHLLEVARAVFLENGIRATTAEVAARAGISEGTIFHRFQSKDALFRAAVRFDPDEVPAFLVLLPARAGKEDLRATLVEVATRLLEKGRVAIPLMMMAWSNPTGDYALAKMAKRGEGYRRMVRPVQEYFEAEARLGRLTTADPELLARVFWGSIHHFCMTELCVVGAPFFHLGPEDYVAGLVNLILAGNPKKAAAPAPRMRKLARP